MTSIYQALTDDHNKHRDLLKKIMDTSGDTQKRRESWDEFYFDVSAHAAAEEIAFYAPLMEKSKGQSESRHSVAEHKKLDDIMKELHEKDMSSPGWLARFKTLKHDYEHHIDEEERDVFPVARKVLGDDQNGKMGQDFTATKSKERKLVTQKAEAALTH